MTTSQAYQILKVKPGASQLEIEQAYKGALRTLLLQIVPGQPLAVRQKAQDQIAQLKTAFELLKNRAKSSASPARPAGYAPPHVRPTAVPPIRPTAMPPMPPTAMPHVRPVTGFPVPPVAMPPIPPVAGFPGPPTGTTPSPFGSGPAPPAYGWVIPAGFVLAAAVMLFIILCCVRSNASPDKSGTARLRVLSVPWSQVEVDGQPLGPSGQIGAFALKPGDHKVVLRQGNRVLSQTVHLSEDSETTVKAQLEKGKIDVIHKRD